MAKPKVISLLKTDKANNIFLNAPILGRPTDIFVQCASYDLKLPVNAQETRVLDIFEETILRMLRIKKCSVGELADIICLEKDLVNFIITRLMEKGLLEDKYTLSDAGMKQLDLQETMRKEVEYQTAKLFIINGCDIILPYIHVGKFMSEDIVEFSPTNITLGFGSIGERKKVFGTCIRKKKTGSNMAILPQVTIKNAIKKYNNLASKRKAPMITLASEYGIESSKGEDIYFHMQASVQAGNSEELMITDGFVSNIDGVLSFIKTVDADLITRIQSKAVSMEMNEGLSLDTTKHLFNGKYPEIIRFCKDTEHHIRKTDEDSSIDDIKQKKEDIRQVVINCYSILEWAFHYLSIKYPISDSLLQVFKRQKTYENFETISNLVRKIGIINLDSYPNLFNSFDGRRAELIYQKSRDTVPIMQMALPMCIIASTECEESEFRTLISQDRRLFQFISYVGKNAADFRHDSTAKNDDLKAEEIYEHTLRLVKIILPDIQINKSDVVIGEHVSNERLKAIVSCEKALGSMLYTSLDEGVQADFRKISPDKDWNELPSPLEYVETLYRILQTIFYEETTKFISDKWMSKEECIKKVEEIFGETLPKSLTTVKNERYNAAQRGYKSSLGAHFLVMVPCLSDENRFLKRQKIVEVVSSVIEYRKHANDISLRVSEKELNELRERVINIVKIIGGYYDGDK